MLDDRYQLSKGDVMARLLSVLSIVLVCVSTGSAGETEAAARPPSTAQLVPGRAKIDPGEDIDRKKIDDFCYDMITAKEAQAAKEIADVRKSAQAKFEKEEAERKEKAKRWNRYMKSIGSDTTGYEETVARSGPNLRITFVVPEIDIYQAASEASLQCANLAQEISSGLATLDKSQDGVLAGEEYRQACHLALSTEKLFNFLDSSGDGMISIDRINSVKALPQGFEAAQVPSMALPKDYHLRKYDTDKNGVLDVEERKALTMAYGMAAVRYRKDAEFYQLVSTGLASRRATANARLLADSR